MDIISLWNAFTALLGVLWTLVLSIADLIPAGRLILLGTVVFLVWRYLLPRKAKEVIRPRVAPVLWTGTAPFRWVIVQGCANPEWLRQPGEALQKQKPAKEVPPPKRRPSPSRRRWFLIGFVCGLAALLLMRHYAGLPF